MKTDADFLHRLQARDQVAWLQLVEQWEQPLYNYIRGNNIRSPQDVEDILLETWGAAPRAIDNFDGQNATLKTFLFSLARRKVADYWRKHRPTDELSEAIAASNTDKANVKMELEEALANLPETERQALVLRYLEGFNVSETAEILGRTYKGTESLLSRARKRLEAELRKS